MTEHVYYCPLCDWIFEEYSAHMFVSEEHAEVIIYLGEL